MGSQILICALCVFTMVSAFLTISMRRKGRSFEGMLCKFLSSFGFMSVGILGFVANQNAEPVYFCLVLFGLLFGLGGDVLLGIKEIAPAFKMKLIAMGTVSFLIGHIFFLVAFMRPGPFHWLPLALAFAVAVISYFLLKICHFKSDAKMSALLIIYYVLLWYKALIAVYMFVVTKDSGYLVAAIGCALFIASDTCLGFLYFTPIKSKYRLVTVELSTYYPAQLLLALSVAFIGR